MEASERIAGALESAGQRRSGNQWTCPLHDGRPSVTLRQGDGKALLLCHSCGKDATPAILEALGLSLADLYDEPRGRKPRTRRRDSREKSPAKIPAPDTGGCCIGCCYPLHDCLPPAVHVKAEVMVYPYERAHNRAPRPYCPECARRHQKWEAAYPARQQDHWPEVPRTSPRGLLLCGMCGNETTDPVGHGICGECFYMLKDREALWTQPLPSARRGT